MVDNEYTRRMILKHMSKQVWDALSDDIQHSILAAIEHAYQDGYEDGANSEDEDK